jgi:hypothetical protein
LDAGHQTGKNQDSQNGAKQAVERVHSKFGAKVWEGELDPEGGKRNPPFEGFQGSTSEILQVIENAVGPSNDVADVVHVGIDLARPGIFVAALTAGHVVLHVILLILRVGDESVAVDVVAGQGMLKARAAHHAEGGGAKSNGAKGIIEVDGCFHSRDVLGMSDCVLVLARLFQVLEGGFRDG